MNFRANLKEFSPQPWVLTLACEMAPFGVAPPIRLAVLDSENRARELSDDELQEHKNNVEGALEYFKKYREIHSPRQVPTAPTTEREKGK